EEGNHERHERHERREENCFLFSSFRVFRVFRGSPLLFSAQRGLRKQLGSSSSALWPSFRAFSTLPSAQACSYFASSFATFASTVEPGAGLAFSGLGPVSFSRSRRSADSSSSTCSCTSAVWLITRAIVSGWYSTVPAPPLSAQVRGSTVVVISLTSDSA